MRVAKGLTEFLWNWLAHPVRSAVLLVGLYALCRLPDILILRGFDIALYPLVSLYIVKHLLFGTHGFLPELASIPLSPASSFVIYPPGIYLLSWVLGQVGTIFLFLFLIQIPVPLLLQRLFTAVCSPVASLGLSLLSTYYLTSATFWAPDFIIQPFMILGVLLLWFTGMEERTKIIRLAGVGLLTGLILVLKHNIGLIFGLACLAWMFFHSWTMATSPGYASWLTLRLVVAGFLGIGLLLLPRLLYPDEIVFYLFPYFLFWGTVLYIAVRNRRIGLDQRRLARGTLVFVTAALVLPVVVFAPMGQAIGYTRYWFSLFQMGLQYLPIWDYGITETIKSQAQFSGVLEISSLYADYTRLVRAAMFVVPFLVSCTAAFGAMVQVKRGETAPGPDIREYLAVTSLGIVGMLMFFPLEGYHILATKLFLFCFVAFYMARVYVLRFPGWVGAFGMALLFLPVMVHVVGKPLAVMKTETSRGSGLVQRLIGLPVEKTLVDELDRRIEVVSRSIAGRPYYIISSGFSVMTLMAFIDNRIPQFYLVMRKGSLNPQVTERIISSLHEAPFVVVSHYDFQKYLAGQHDDPFVEQLIDFVHENFVEIDRYDPPSNQALLKIHGFSIMAKKTTDLPLAGSRFRGS